MYRHIGTRYTAVFEKFATAEFQNHVNHSHLTPMFSNLVILCKLDTPPKVLDICTDAIIEKVRKSQSDMIKATIFSIGEKLVIEHKYVLIHRARAETKHPH
jgi:hypothetical protein